MRLMRGADLSPTVQRAAKLTYVNRLTGDHIPPWAAPGPDGKAPRLQFASDRDWLEHTYFAVNRRGLLLRRKMYCESTPTWPDAG